MYWGCKNFVPIVKICTERGECPTLGQKPVSLKYAYRGKCPWAVKFVCPEYFLPEDIVTTFSNHPHNVAEVNISLLHNYFTYT